MEIENFIKDIKEHEPFLRQDVERFELEIRNFKQLGDSNCIKKDSEAEECYEKLGVYLWKEYTQRLEQLMLIGGFLVRIKSVIKDIHPEYEEDGVKEVDPPLIFSISPDSSKELEHIEQTVENMKKLFDQIEKESAKNKKQKTM
jgi:hypothetical protein